VDHLKKVGLGYWGHARQALAIAGALFVYGLSGVIHALYPALFTETMSGGIDKLNKEINAKKKRGRSRGRP